MTRRRKNRAGAVFLPPCSGTECTRLRWRLSLSSEFVVSFQIAAHVLRLWKNRHLCNPDALQLRRERGFVLFQDREITQGWRLFKIQLESARAVQSEGALLNHDALRIPCGMDGDGSLTVFAFGATELEVR